VPGDIDAANIEIADVPGAGGVLTVTVVGVERIVVMADSCSLDR
jgi:hypothetical protein